MNRLLCLLPLTLAACDRPDKNICITPPTLEDALKEPPTALGWAAKSDGCVARWATRLAGAPGSTREIAAAAIGGCTDALESHASASDRENQKDGFASAGYAAYLADYRRNALEKAMFYVAMARAGRCAVS